MQTKRTLYDIRKVALSVMALILLFSPTLYGQVRVIGISPKPNSTMATVSQPILIVFSESIDSSSISPGIVLIYGEVGGTYANTIFVEDEKLIIDHPLPFFNGERIWVSVSKDLKSTSGQQLGGFSFYFDVRNEYGSGEFVDSTFYGLKNAIDPVTFITFDFNNDLLPDIVTADFTSGTVTVLQNIPSFPSLRFARIFHFNVGEGPIDLAAADINGDRKTDLVVANFLENTIAVLQNTSSVFEAQFIKDIIQVGEKPAKVKLHDFDFDGDLDLAVLSFGRDRIEFYENNGNGQFSPVQQVSTPPAPSDIAFGDWNKDGLLDLVISSVAQGNVIICYGQSQPFIFSVQDSISLGISPTKIFIGDILATATDSSKGSIPELFVLSQLQNTIQIYGTQNDKVWSELIQEFKGVSQLTDFFLADIDNYDPHNPTGTDYDLDLLVCSYDSSYAYIIRNNNTQFFDDLDVSQKILSSNPIAIMARDFDRDGDQDIALLETKQQRIKIWWNRGSREGKGTCEFGGDIKLNVIDFDSVLVTSQKTLYLKITNITELPDTLFTLIPAPQLSMFTTIDSTLIIPPFSSLDLPVTFAPRDTGFFRSEMTVIVRNISALTQEIFYLKGTGIRPIPVAIPDTLNFEAVPPGKSKQMAVTIANRGNTSAVVSFKSLSPQDGFRIIDSSLVTIGPKETIALPIFEFSPTLFKTYFSTVLFETNDPLRPEISVYLKGEGSEKPPVITSPDTIYATEDQNLQYQVTAEDPDNDSLRIEYLYLPKWLMPTPQNKWILEGTPREGDLDTLFAAVVSDGFLNDTIEVTVLVTPVNDPPVLKIRPNQTQFVLEEQTQVAFDLTAYDPEDSTLIFLSSTLPEGAQLNPIAKNQMRFEWIPDFGQAGQYTIVFTVREAYESPPLSDALTVHIKVNKRLPDLHVVEFSSDSSYTYKFRPFHVKAVISNTEAPVHQPFHITISTQQTVLADTTIPAIGLSEEIVWQPQLILSKLGMTTLTLWIDKENEIEEKDENNNTSTLHIDVKPGKLYVHPNPFTPNNDGYNDHVMFDFREFTVFSPKIRIWDFEGRPIITLNKPSGTFFFWDGKDERNNPQPPGVYLYQFFDGNNALANGYVVLAR